MILIKCLHLILSKIIFTSQIIWIKHIYIYIFYENFINGQILITYHVVVIYIYNNYI